jgi:hypothetical protein
MTKIKFIPRNKLKGTSARKSVVSGNADSPVSAYNRRYRRGVGTQNAGKLQVYPEG